MKSSYLLVIAGALFVSTLFILASAHAAEPAGDCSMLPVSLADQVMGRNYDEPSIGKMPPAFGVKPWGTTCEYHEKAPFKSHSASRIDFIVYVDSSAAEAKQTFEKLAMWFPAKEKLSGVGDAAYIDQSDRIHVLKGKVRFAITLSPVNDKQLQALSNAVAGKI